jgi:hypothetical protein
VAAPRDVGDAAAPRDGGGVVAPRDVGDAAAPRDGGGAVGPRDGGEGLGGAGALEEELGDLMFAVVNLTRLAGAHALTALHSANAKFTRRFEALERLAAERGIALETAGLEQLDRLWDEVKRGE